MKVFLDVFSLLESASGLVNSTTLAEFKRNRDLGNLESKPKRSKITNAIVADPKKFFNLSMDTLLVLSGLTRTQFRGKVALAVQNLTAKKYKNKIQCSVFECDDERVLRGDFSFLIFEIEKFDFKYKLLGSNNEETNETAESELDITFSAATEDVRDIELDQRINDLEVKVAELQAELDDAKSEIERVKPITELFKNRLVRGPKNGYYPINGKMTKFCLHLLW